MVHPAVPNGAPAPKRRSGSLFFVGNATTVIRYGGLTVLTDPNFLHRGQRAYLGHGLTSRRRTEPALSIGQLPQLDAIVLSHLHGDHWDRVARRHLDRSLPVITTPQAARRLRRWHGFGESVGLDTWESHTLAKGDVTLRVTALPGRHAGGPARALLPPVMGSLLEFGSGAGDVECRLYVTGDTLMFGGVHEIAQRFPEIDLGVLHLGGTKILRLLLVTMDAAQGVELLQVIRPARAVPIHYDDYTVFTSPLSDFRHEVAENGLGDVVVYVERGGTVSFTGRTDRRL